jgi:putative ABC transport system permease protein
MKLPDLTELATRNLREAVLRNSLTTVGIAVGVASLVALLSLGVGLQQLVNRSVARAGLFDVVSVRARQNFPGRGRRNNGAPEDTTPPRALDDSARQEITQLPNVVEVDPEVRFTAEARIEPRGQITQVAGMAPSSEGSGTLEGMTGKFFSGPDAQEAIIQGDLGKRLLEDEKTPESLIGQTITLKFPQRQTLPAADQAQRGGSLSPEEQAMGFSITPAQKTFRIVGVIPSSDSGGGQVGITSAGVYLPLNVASGLDVVQGGDLREVMQSSSARGGRLYPALNVRASSPAAVADIETAVTRMGFAAFSLIDVTRNLRVFFAIFDLFLGIFGSLALAVASLGIVNTLVMAILERRREIGVLKALGAADRDVRRLFFAEAGVMGLVGGALGVILGWGIGRAIQFGTAIYLRRQGLNSPNIWSVPWWLVLGAIAFAVLVSLASGIYPASRAARLDPVQALRYE